MMYNRAPFGTTFYNDILGQYYETINIRFHKQTINTTGVKGFLSKYPSVSC